MSECIECRQPALSRDDGRCYLCGKIWDGLVERPPRKRSDRPRTFIADSGDRLLRVKE